VAYKTQPGGRFCRPPLSLDAQLASLAARQHGVVTAAQLADLGLSQTATGKRAAAGRLHRVHRGVYAVGHAGLSREGRWMAAVLAAGEGAALAGLSAAVHWQAWRRRVDTIEVLAPGKHRAQRGFQILRCRNLDPRDVTVHRGIRITTVARLLVDLTETRTPAQIANVIHEAVWRNRFSVEATRAAMTRATGRHRLSVLEIALALHAAGSAGTKSDPEDDFLALIDAAGLPEPLTNVHVQAAGQAIEVDFRWGDLCLEVDGHGHTRPRTRAEDHQRDADLRSHGYTVLRIPAATLERDPSTVLAQVLDAMDLATPSPAAVRRTREAQMTA
jgi:hypothetical protein